MRRCGWSETRKAISRSPTAVWKPPLLDSARQAENYDERFGVQRQINLSGGEISILKTLGLSGASTPGTILKQRIGDMETAEFLDELNGLIMLGYVLASKMHIGSMEDLERSFFRVNASYSRDLRDAVAPARRREDHSRRRRRRSSGAE
jgi:hypothetical protein